MRTGDGARKVEELKLVCYTLVTGRQRIAFTMAKGMPKLCRICGSPKEVIEP